MMKPSFVKHIAYLQILGCMLVVFGHCFVKMPEDNDAMQIFLTMLCNVRMPLFTFVSGFLMYYTTFGREGYRPISPWSFTLKKVLRLLVPCFFLETLTFMPRCILNSVADKAMDLSGIGYLQALCYGDMMVIQYLWFLQMSFILLSVTYLLIWTSHRIRIDDSWGVCALIALLVVLRILDSDYPRIFSIYRLVDLGPWFMLGILYARRSAIVDAVLKLDHALTFPAAFVAWQALYWTGAHVVASLFGIIMFVALAKWLERNDYRLLDRFIGSSYMIYLLSWFFIVAGNQLLYAVIPLPWWCHTTIGFILAVTGPWLIYRHMSARQHLLPYRIIGFFLGQKFKFSGKEQNNSLLPSSAG